MVHSPRCSLWSDLVWSGPDRYALRSNLFCGVSCSAVACQLHARCKTGCTTRVQLPNTTCTYLSLCDP